MIKVTGEMLQLLVTFHSTDITRVAEKLHGVAERIIELHEANKPKPKPLNADQVFHLYYKDANVCDIFAFARAIEKAHGIGV